MFLSKLVSTGSYFHRFHTEFLCFSSCVCLCYCQDPKGFGVMWPVTCKSTAVQSTVSVSDFHSSPADSHLLLVISPHRQPSYSTVNIQFTSTRVIGPTFCLSGLDRRQSYNQYTTSTPRSRLAQLSAQTTFDILLYFPLLPHGPPHISRRPHGPT